MPDQLLELNLSVPEKTHRINQPVPVRISVRNASDKPLWIVGVLDGSEACIRYPRYRPQIRMPATAPPAEPLECGMVAPLRQQDFVQLPPGESFDPTQSHDDIAFLPIRAFSNFVPTVAGIYELSLELSTSSETDEQWLGILEYPGHEKVREKLKKVPRLKVKSNIVVIEVKG